MFKNRGLFGLLKPRSNHSLEHLKQLYYILYKNQTVTENNRSLLVETLRSIAEILIWGDQNDSSVFDFFLERNMLSFFLKIMNQKCGSYVCVQLLQTLNILFENIRNETSIYYLLSNNHVNSIIVHKFDFSDEEVMAYYISFLKTLSFRLNKHTIHFFYNEHTNDFPLYTEALKFFNHSESMVRIAVRTLTLNVYKVEEESMLQFVVDKTAVPYFSNLVYFIGNHILEIDACVKNDPDHRNINRLKDLVAEHLDHLHYLNDILCLNIDNLNLVLSDHLMNILLIPLYLFSLVRESSKEPHVSKVTALFLICQIFLIIKHVPLVRLLAWVILSGDKEIFTERGAAKLALFKANLSMDLPPENIDLSGRIYKPSFVAPSQPLEKSIREQIQKDEPREQGKVKSQDGLVIDQDDARSKSPPDGCSESSDDAHCVPVTTYVDPKDLSITDEEKELMRMAATAAAALAEDADVEPPDGPVHVSLEARPFLKSIFECLDPSETDYLTLFSLCLIYVIQQNSGIGEPLRFSVGFPRSSSATKFCYNNTLVERLINILSYTCKYGSKIRLITLDLSVLLLKELVMVNKKSFLSVEHFSQIQTIKEECAFLLRNFYKSEEIFLDMFEDEYRECVKPYLSKMEYVLSDASLLLPPTPTPLTGIEFQKRLPCGEVERTRLSIRTFFSLRQLSLDMEGKTETKLPLSSSEKCVQIQDVLDLNNADILAVKVTKNFNSVNTIGQRQYLVVDLLQVVLVEPDRDRLGWGVATFVGFLQDLEVVTDKDDSRCLHVTFHSPCGARSQAAEVVTNSRIQRPAPPIMTATFTFDDHIRCMAAKQRLTKGRSKARRSKMQQIEQLLGLTGPVPAECPSPPSVNLAFLRQEAAMRRIKTGSTSTRSPTQLQKGEDLSNEQTNNPDDPHGQKPRNRQRSRQRHQLQQNFPGVSSANHQSSTSPHRNGTYKPLFVNQGRVPGSAALLRETSMSRSSSRAQTPDSMNGEDSNALDRQQTVEGYSPRSSYRLNQRRLAASKLSQQDKQMSLPQEAEPRKTESTNFIFGSPLATNFFKRTLQGTQRAQTSTSVEDEDIALEDYNMSNYRDQNY